MITHSLPAAMPSLLKLAASAALAAAFALSPFAASAQDSSSSEPPAAAAPAVDPSTVVATVNGLDITEADLAFIYDDLGQQVQQIPQDQLRAVLIAQMVDLRLAAAGGREMGMDQEALYKLRINYLADRALRTTYLNKIISEAVTQADIQAEYDRQVAAMPQEDEVRARHILVTTEDDAKAIKAQLDGGADFEALAKEKSTEPGAAQSGGDLGYFTHDMMVAPFADAAFAMKVGDVSNPVQTQFGWHIIKLEDRRPKAKPTLEELTQQITQQLSVAQYTELLGEMHTAATITVVDPAVQGQVLEQLGIGAPPAADTSSSSEPAAQ